MNLSNQSYVMKEDGACLRILKAEHGDAFIVEVKRGVDRFVMVIDGGPKGVSGKLEKYLENLDIDLVVLTHFDEDHIHGMLWYLKDHEDKALSVKKYWLNMPHLIDMPNDSRTISYKQALKLSDFMEKLENINPKLDWRDDIVGGRIYDIKNQLVNIEVLTPSPEAKKANEIAYAEELKKDLESRGKMLPLGDSSKKGEGKDERKENQKKSLEELLHNHYQNKQICNAASIALIITLFDGTKLLMAGDITPDELTKALSERGYTKERPLEVDLFKVPHHGSKFNITLELLALVETSQYLISTNGGKRKSFHPDREALAKILLNPTRDKDKKITLYLNYSLERIRGRVGDFIKDKEIIDKKYNFELIDDCEEIILNAKEEQ